jgi:ectoine hydroxylase-related dioxygenase (phytanoyl-CoA dioxygenase family)
LVSEQLINSFNRDGVVCLRGAFDQRWLELAASGIDQNLAAPGPFFRDQTPPDSPSRYVFDYWTWRDFEPFRELVLHGPAAGIAGALLRSPSVTMVMDNWFLREGGATGAAPWHHDEPYFDFQGRMLNTWIPLEAVGDDDGLEFIVGSHRWGKVFRPLHFRTHEPFEGVGDDYPELPDLDADSQAHERRQFTLEPGDCLVFDLRTLHRSTGGRRPARQTRRRYTLRYAAEGAVFQPRGPWTREISEYLVSMGQAVGGRLECPLLPRTRV